MEKKLDQDISIEYFIKIRIGEPITALDIDQYGVTFGSISGYVGHYKFGQNQCYYDNVIYNEMIRDIECTGDGYAYCMVGDECILHISFKDSENIIKKLIDFEGKTHNTVCCSNTISYIKNGKAILAYFPSTFNKREGFGVGKPVSAIIDFEEENLKELEKFKIGNFCAPMDFDGHYLMFIDHEVVNNKKKVQVFDCLKQEFEEIIDYPAHKKQVFNFLFFRDKILYVDEKTVLIIQNETPRVKTVTKCKHEIVIMGVYSHICEIPKGGKTFVRRETTDLESGNAVTTVSQDIIIYVDVEGNVYVNAVSNGQLIVSFNLYKLAGFPTDFKKYKLYNMGYPHKITWKHSYLALTCDFGVFVIRLQL